MGVPWWGWVLISFGAFWSLVLVLFMASIISLMWQEDDCDPDDL